MSGKYGLVMSVLKSAGSRSTGSPPCGSGVPVVAAAGPTSARIATAASAPSAPSTRVLIVVCLMVICISLVRRPTARAR